MTKLSFVWRFLGLLAVVGCGGATRPAPLTAAKTQPSSVATPLPGPNRNAATECAEGFKPSQQFKLGSWMEAYAFVKKASMVWEADDPTSEEEARDGLCLGSSGLNGMPPRLRVDCRGDHWMISTDHDHDMDHQFLIVPWRERVLVFDAGQIGGGQCEAKQDATVSRVESKLEGARVSIKSSSESFVWAGNVPAAEACQRSHTDVAEYTYDLAAGLGCEAFHVE